MARRGRRQSSVSSADTIDNARPDLDGLLDPLPALPVDPLDLAEPFLGPSIPYDRRPFSFGEIDGPYNLTVSPTPVRSSSSSPSALPGGVAFERPEAVAICVRRKVRREVIHALGRRKSRGGGFRRRSWRSDIKC